MEYERIHKVQTGMISPSKLRMKLIGAYNNQKKKDGSNCNSSTTSPSRLEDSQFLRNSLLDAQTGDFGDEASTLEVLPIRSDSSQVEETSLQSKELMPMQNPDGLRFKIQLVSKGETSNSRSVHPVRNYEDENLDYDSTSSFEFHKERSLHHSVTRSFSRPMPSKWNDAEKWIMNRQNGNSNISKKTNLQNRPLMKKVEFCQPIESVKFGAPISGYVNGVNGMIDLGCESKDLKEMDETGLPRTKNVTEEDIDVPAVRSVSMRDMGTEMTPIPSQEPSRTATPVSATTPLRSPTSSVPSTPRRGEPAPTPTDNFTNDGTQNVAENGKKGLSEQEMKLKTRREIVALGVQLGKINIAEWASKGVKEKTNEVDLEELEHIENEKRAVAWEEAEKSKHAARFKREEIRLQAWESQQKAKLEAEMRKIEAQIDHMKAQAEAQMVKKVALARQKSQEKRVAAEVWKKRLAKKTAEKAEFIRETGRIPSSPFICCRWS